MTRILLLVVCAIAATTSPAASQDTNDIVRPANGSAYSRAAYEAGRRDAERDIRDNHLAVEITGGPPAPWDAEWARMLRERFQIELRESGCVVDYRISGHERGYNEVSFAEIQRRFGRDVLRDTRAEAQKQWEAGHSK